MSRKLRWVEAIGWILPIGDEEGVFGERGGEDVGGGLLDKGEMWSGRNGETSGEGSSVS